MATVRENIQLKKLEHLELIDFIPSPRKWHTVHSFDYQGIITDSTRIYKHQEVDDLRTIHTRNLKLTPLIGAISIIAGIGMLLVCAFSSSDKTFQHRLKDTVIQAIQICITPVLTVALEVSALFGLIFPYGGRKIYTSLHHIGTKHHFLQIFDSSFFSTQLSMPGCVEKFTSLSEARILK